MKQGLSCIPWFEVQDSNLSNVPLLDFLVTCNKTTVCAVEEGRMKCSNDGRANERTRSGGSIRQNPHCCPFTPGLSKIAGFALLVTLLQDRTSHHCSGQAFSGACGAPRTGTAAPRPAPSFRGGLELGPTGM